MADDPGDDLPREGDTGATGRAPRPQRPPDQEFSELDSSFAEPAFAEPAFAEPGPAEPAFAEPPRDEPAFFERDDELPAFFEEDDEPAMRRQPVEDFGFDDIARDDEPVGAAARGRGARGRGGARGRRTGGGGARRSRGGGAPPRRTRPASGGRGGRPPAASPLSTPAARIAIGVAFVLLLVLVLAFVIRDCRRDALVDSYRTYVNSAGQVADESAQQGQQLLTTLQNRDRRNAAALQQQVSALATQADELVQRVEDLDPPDGLSDQHRSLVMALQYRANGMAGLAEALPGIIRSNNQRFAARNIAAPMKRLVASDVIYRDSFADPTAAKIRDEGIDGLEVATDALLLPGANDRLATEAGARTLLAPLRRTGGSGNQGGGSGNLRGTSLTGVVAEPSKTTLSTETVTTIPASSSLEWVVTVRNGGDFVENGIVVTATLRYPSGGGATEADAQEATIETIDPGKEVTVRIPGPPSDAWQPGQEGSLEVAVQPVDGEQNTDNNRAEYPVTITVG